MKVFSVAIVERAYNPHSAAAKQKCLTHLERDSRSALASVVLTGIGPLASAVGEILTTARTLVSGVSCWSIESRSDGCSLFVFYRQGFVTHQFEQLRECLGNPVRMGLLFPASLTQFITVL